MSKIKYAQEFFAATQQLGAPESLRTFVVGRRWAEAPNPVPAEEAAQWAARGFVPEEAAPLIADGITPEMHTAAEEAAIEVAGSPEEHAMRVIDRLFATGQLRPSTGNAA